MSECQICYDNDKSIVCTKCDFQFCTECFLKSDTKEFRCFSCNLVLSNSFIYKQVGKKNFDKLFEKINREFFKQEKGRLPETIARIEMEKEQQRLNHLYEQLKCATSSMGSVISYHNVLLKMCSEKESELKDLIADEYVYMCEHYNKLMEKKAEIGKLLKTTKGKDDTGPRFYGKCGDEKCSGLLDAGGKCVICNKKFCRSCLVPAHDGDCDETVLANVQAIRKETRPCPKCYTRIFKISGCDQMFCTNCHTPFSWRTGKIETGRIHNPHYYEIQRQTKGFVPREVGDVQCGGPDLRLARSILDKIGLPAAGMISLYQALPGLIQWISIDAHRINERGHANRVRYLENKNEKQWFSNFKKLQKEIQRTQDICNILQTFHALLGDTMLVPDKQVHQQVLNMIRDIFTEMGQVYNNKMPIIYDNYKLRYKHYHHG